MGVGNIFEIVDAKLKKHCWFASHFPARRRACPSHDWLSAFAVKRELLSSHEFSRLALCPLNQYPHDASINSHAQRKPRERSSIKVAYHRSQGGFSRATWQ